MFTVPKTEVATHWWACTGYVEERTGECPDTDSYFTDFRQAYAAAVAAKSEQLNKEYDKLVNRVSNIALFVYRIRALWNNKISESLKRYKQQLAEAQLAANSFPEVKVVRLPKEIPVLGKRLTIGATVYEIDSYNLTMRVADITKEEIRYYSFKSNGSEAYYRLSNDRMITSTLRSNFSNVHIFLDSVEANNFLNNLIQQRIEELKKQLQ